MQHIINYTVIIYLYFYCINIYYSITTVILPLYIYSCMQFYTFFMYDNNKIKKEIYLYKYIINNNKICLLESHIK